MSGNPEDFSIQVNTKAKRPSSRKSQRNITDFTPLVIMGGCVVALIAFIFVMLAVDSSTLNSFSVMGLSGLVVWGVLIAGILSGLLWLWMLIDCLMNESSEGNDKITWLLLMIFIPVLGAILYLLLRRPERIRRTGK